MAIIDKLMLKQIAIVAAGIVLVTAFAMSVEIYMRWPAGSQASMTWRVIMVIVVFSSILPFDILAIKVTTKGKTEEQT